MMIILTPSLILVSPTNFSVNTKMSSLEVFLKYQIESSQIIMNLINFHLLKILTSQHDKINISGTVGLSSYQDFPDCNHKYK